MDSYNLIERHAHDAERHFNTDIVRKEWGFNGVMMSDWVATYDGVAAANGGLDLEMPTGAYMNQQEPAAGDQEPAQVRWRRLMRRFGTFWRRRRDLAGSIAISIRPIFRSRPTTERTMRSRWMPRAKASCC